MTERDTPSNFSSHLASRNVVVVGGTGVGKSSFINLIIDLDKANTSNDVRGVTTQPSAYPWKWKTDTRTHAFCLWDTPGLDEGSFGSVTPKIAQDVLRLLLKKLNQESGVHLLVLCIRGTNHITKGMRQIYEVVLRIRNQVSPRTPIAAVVTELEKWCNRDNIIPSMEEWWTSNESRLVGFGMMFCGHACLTTQTDDRESPIGGLHAECQLLARNLLTNHSLSCLPLMLTRNVVVVGATGVGKSSIINLVVGSDSAVVNSDASAVTLGTSYHDWIPLEMQTFRLWDTPGLGQGPSGSRSPKYAFNAMQSLLTELGRGPGVHLIVVCFQGRRITSSMKQAYETILALSNRVCSDTPLVAVVSGLEDMSNVNLDMSFAGHVCITTLTDDAHPPAPGRRDKCQLLVRNLIIDHALVPCGVPAHDVHVILFGETGVGKSSLVRLLTGCPVAEGSADSVAFTSTEYQFQLGPATLRLWDTVGLNQPENDKNRYAGAIEKAVELIKRVNVSGGISLFLFCVSGNEVTMTTIQRNYRVFYEVLGRQQVPIALVVTHLECEPVMEAWWERNTKTLEQNGICVSGHACITTLERHPKYAESRQVVQELLWRYAEQGKFALPSETWLGRLLSGLSTLLGLGLPKGKDLTRFLTTRCHLEADVAQRVADCIEPQTDKKIHGTTIQ